MLQNQLSLHGVLSIANGTYAHETSPLFGHLYTNTLRRYDDRGRRSRRPADTLALRQELIDSLQQRYADVRTVKIKDSGRLFSATVKTAGGRTLHRTAYSLPQLAQRLCEWLNAFYTGPLA